jgi:3-hydroxyisobutyrate dehydrogenase-like beta-hydroxyacid dehydrogenase
MEPVALPADAVAGIPCTRLEDAARAEICLLILADSPPRTAYSNTRTLPTRRHLILDMGSSDPARSKVHAARLAAGGIGWVDAPVSGGPEGVNAGSLAIMVGGVEADVARAQPLLDVLGGNVVRVGGPGAGHTAKVINQLIVGLTIEAVAEALTLAEKCGLDPQRVQQALRGGFADSKVLQMHGTRMITRAYVPGGRARLQLKDLRHAVTLAAGTGIRLPHLESTVALYERLVAQGDGDLDHSALHKLLWPAS